MVKKVTYGRLQTNRAKLVKYMELFRKRKQGAEIATNLRG